MRVEQAINIADLHRMAKRRLPRIAFDFIEGGIEDEHGIARNEAAFLRHRLIPRYLVDVSKRDQSTKLFDRIYASPFGFAPTGTVGLFRRGGDLMLAQAAASANIPYVMSGASNATLEAAVKVAPDHTWYQLYAAQDSRIAEDLIRRSRDAGIGVLVLTVDVPVRGKRERNIRNGFSFAHRLKPSIFLEALTHPAWIVEYLRHGGVPLVENWLPYAGADASAEAVIRFFDTQTPAAAQQWRELEGYRRLWPGVLIVKGILHPDDAVRAADVGADGIIVSNHGGRQLDRAPSPLEVLPAIKAAVGDRLVLMLDSGVRRGADIVVALCLGVRFVFVGRAAVYGVAAGGLAGAKRTIDILREEIDLALAQIGCPRADRLAPEFLLSER
jgi:(S)-mandelate dehydrogenase